jgi:uncharacterized lipoprotein
MAVLAGPTLGACALTTDTIVLGYQPQPWARPLGGADQVVVHVIVQDERRDRSRVGCKKNGYGAEMAPIVSVTDVAAFVRATVEGELARRGFKAGPTGVVVNVDLRKYYNDFKPGFFSGDAQAEVVLDVSAFKLEAGQEGPPLFVGHFEGIGDNRGIQMYTGDNAKIALDAAYAEAMRLMFSDRRFLAAPVQTAAPSPAAAPATPAAPAPTGPSS